MLVVVVVESGGNFFEITAAVIHVQQMQFMTGRFGDITQLLLTRFGPERFFHQKRIFFSFGFCKEGNNGFCCALTIANGIDNNCWTIVYSIATGVLFMQLWPGA